MPFDENWNINGTYIGAGGESIAYRKLMKVIKFPIDDSPRIRIEDFINKLTKIKYTNDSARIPEIRNFKRLTPEQKEHLPHNEQFANVVSVYETDYIPNEIYQWTPALALQALRMFQILLQNGFAATDIAGQNWRSDNTGKLYFIDAGDIRYAEDCIESGCTQSTFLFYVMHILQYSFGRAKEIPLIDLLTVIWQGWEQPIYKDGGYGHIDWRIARCFLPKEFDTLLYKIQNLTMNTLEETIMHVGDAVDLIKQGKIGPASNPNIIDIMKNKYGDYQQAFVANDLTLTPDGYSIGKWNVIEKVAKVLDKQQFSWVDLGACYGIFGFMLAQTYPQSSGVLNNIVEAELVANRFVAHVKGISNRVTTQNCSWKDVTGTFDLVLCMSLVHHLLGSGHTIKTFCDNLKKMVNPNGIIVLEVPTKGDFQGQLLEKTHMGRTVDVEDFVSELPEFELLWKEKVDYTGNVDIVRNVGIFRRK